MLFFFNFNIKTITKKLLYDTIFEFNKYRANQPNVDTYAHGPNGIVYLELLYTS